MYLRPRHVSVAIPTGLLLAAAWLGCAEGPLRPEPTPEERIHELRSGDWRSVAWTGMTLPVSFQATDSAGFGVAGAVIDLEVVKGSGTLSASSAVTDSSGRVSVEITISSAGENAVHATARGTPTVAAWWVPSQPRPRVQLDTDSVHLSGTSCQGSLYAQVLDDQGDLILASSVRFAPTNPGIVSFYSITVTGNYRGMMTGVTAEEPGATSIIATHDSGVADTAFITVAPDVVSDVSIVEAANLHAGGYALPGDFATPLLGDTLRWALWTPNPCSRHIPDVPVEWSSTNPAVATVDEGVVVIHQHGRALVIGSAEGLADTVQISTLQVEPLNGRIAVGDTLRYQVRMADSTGTLQPYSSFWAQGVGVQAGSEVASTVLVDGWPSTRVVGIRPGTARIWLHAGAPFLSAFVNLEVTAP